jgi:site-specific recombinase XerD
LGRFHTIDLPPRSISWLDDYARFLERDRGLRPISRTQHIHIATRYLRWQFGTRAPSWSRVRVEDVWRYAQKRRRDGYSARSLNTELSRLRQFFRFVHLRGACGPLLAKAVPAFSERGRKTPRSDVISEAERIRFLDSFGKQAIKDLRDYAMALCMLELGLRCIEVARLRLDSIDWNQKTLAVPPAKGGGGRTLPLPRLVSRALRAWLKVRPGCEHDRLFVCVWTFGRPITCAAISAAMQLAYRRCGIDRWGGTHALRHSFASRLLRRGANIKEIADLLGHRLLCTTNCYTHASVHDLQPLVRPWPR